MPRAASNHRQNNPIMTAVMLPVILVVLIVALPFMIPGLIWGVLLRLRFWQIARHQGRFVLLVYSNSRHWKEYFEQSILPRVQDHAIILNWSERAQWDHWSWAVQAFRHWGGQEDFNPLAVVSCGFVKVRVFRFYKAFREYKRGNAAPLQEVESRFLQAVMAAGGAP